ncbi:MAG: hypothetical protein ABEJ98_02990 [Candidatus Nanohaloarchaea archaeon]
MEKPFYKNAHATKWFGIASGRFDSDEVMEYYERTMGNLEEVAEEYGREFGHEGVSFGKNLRYGSEEVAKAETVEEARELEAQGLDLLGNSSNFFEEDSAQFYTEDGTVTGHFTYKPGHYYRGANVAGRVTVWVDENEEIGDQEEQDLKDAVDDALNDEEGWELPLLR